MSIPYIDEAIKIIENLVLNMKFIHLRQQWKAIYMQLLSIIKK